MEEEAVLRPEVEVVAEVVAGVVHPEVAAAAAAAGVVGVGVAHPEVVVGAEVGAEVLHHSGVAGAVGAVGAQIQDHSPREEEEAVRREAPFFLAGVKVVQV